MSADLPQVKYTDHAPPVNSSSPGAGYEFTPEQNAVLSSLSSKLQGVGFVVALIGILNAGFAALILLSQNSDPFIRAMPTQTFAAVVLIYVIHSVVYGLIGVWTRGAGDSFREVAQTQGKDIGHLMEGLRDLHKIYSLLYTLILFAVVVFLVALVLATFGSFITPPVPAGT